jgi:MFS family permease
VSLAVANGLYFSFSVFLVPLVEEFRWSRGLTAGALSLSTIVQGVLAPIAGILVDRFGPRRVILAGVVLLSTASVLSSTIHSPSELYGYTGLLAAAGLVGLGPVPMGVLLSRWFTERRGRAVGIAFSGMGFGVFITGPLAQWLIATLGWREASATLGLGALVILLPLAWLGAHDPSPRDPRSGREEQDPHAEPGTASAAGWGAPERRSGLPTRCQASTEYRRLES